MNKSKILDLVKRYKEITVLQNELNEEKDELKELIKKEMKSKSLSKLLLEGYTVTYSEFNVEMFDKQLFKEQHSKMYNQYTYTQTQTKLIVK